MHHWTKWQQQSSDEKANVTIAWSVHLSVTLVHPAEAVERNEMPFGRDTRMIPSNIVIETGQHPVKPMTWLRVMMWQVNEFK